MSRDTWVLMPEIHNIKKKLFLTNDAGTSECQHIEECK